LKKKWKTKRFTPMVIFGIIAFSLLAFMIGLPALASMIFDLMGNEDMAKFFGNIVAVGFVLYFFMGMIGGPVMGSVYLIRWFKRKKPEDTEKVMAWGKKRGYDFQPFDTKTMKTILKSTPIYGKAQQKATNVLSGTYNGNDIYCCEWTSVPVYQGKQYQKIKIYIYVTAIYSGLSGGRLDVRPETIVDSAFDLVGKKDLEFENKKFNDRFNISAKPEKFGYEFFQPKVMQHFMRGEMPFNMFVRNGWIYFYVWFTEHQGGDIPGAFSMDISYMDWLNTVPDFAMELVDILPKYTKKATKVKPLDETIVTIVCPLCDTTFKVWQGKKNIECPKCKAEGEL